MYVSDFMNEFEVNDYMELCVILELRHRNDANAFWMSENPDSYPRLGILARGDLYTLTYFSALGGTTHRSVGNLKENGDGNTVFYLENDGEREIVPNQLIVLSNIGLEAAKEFFTTQDLPQSIEWLEI